MAQKEKAMNWNIVLYNEPQRGLCISIGQRPMD